MAGMETRSATAGLISSKMKTTYTPTVYGVMSCDILNMKSYFKIFNTVKQNKDDSCEKVVHLILVAGSMHNQAMEKVLLPLVKQLKGGETMAQELSTLVEEKEKMAMQIHETKKHLDNKEFVKLMQEFEKLCVKGCDITESALDAMSDEIDEDVLVQAADKVEQLKMSLSTVMPRQMSSA